MAGQWQCGTDFLSGGQLTACRSTVAGAPSSGHHTARTSAKHAQSHHKKKAKKQPHTASASGGSVQLSTEPGAGYGLVYRLIKSARHTIDITMYEFADTTAAALLVP